MEYPNTEEVGDFSKKQAYLEASNQADSPAEPRDAARAEQAELTTQVLPHDALCKHRANADK